MIEIDPNLRELLHNGTFWMGVFHAMIALAIGMGETRRR